MSLNKFEPTDYGTPQGSIISPTLANLTLNGIQDQVYKSILSLTKSKEKRLYIKHADGKITRPLVSLFIVRYADDFVILARSKHIMVNYVKPQVSSFLEERGLTLSSEKTKLFTLKDERKTLNFLGYSFKYHRNWKHDRGFLKAHIAASGIALFPQKEKLLKFTTKLRKIFRNSQNLEAFSLIAKLNPRIRG